MGEFPIPFLLLVLGYTFILVIDKVMFDAHDILDGHNHEHLPQDPRVMRASLVLREQMAKQKD